MSFATLLARTALALALLPLAACGDTDADAPAGETTVVSGETDAPVPGRAADAPDAPPADLADAAADTTDLAQPVTITAMQAGDVACYVTLTDATGATREEMADFEICEREDLIGTPVTVTTEMGNVMAASCQGDPDCPDSETVRLIVSATPAAN